MMMPARVALALQADGWWIRSEIIWHKPNPMPESCTDRPTSAHEKLYLLSKSARYFYDAEAVRVAQRSAYQRALPEFSVRGSQSQRRTVPPGSPIQAGESHASARPSADYAGANLRNVWTIPTHSFSEAHFATFPPKLVEPCIKAGTSENGGCVSSAGGLGFGRCKKVTGQSSTTGSRRLGYWPRRSRHTMP